ncbi:MAG: polysaccharide deacetylase family protein [Anaerostipes sp.]|jgi:polysaccharide deacetylase family sporulation protein PdaB
MRRILLWIFFIGIFFVGIRGGKQVVSTVTVLNPNVSKDLPIYSVETSKKVISLTFDTAWGNEDMKEILSILKRENVTATFFFSGEWVQKYPKDIKKIAKAGHDIGNHGDTHKHMTTLSKENQKIEIIEAQEKVKGITGETMELFRAPFGDYDASVVRNARELGYEVIQWDVDSLDWKEYGVNQMIDKVCHHKNLQNGSILLLHTGTKYTKKALAKMIQNLKHQGYTFLPVSKLIYKGNYYIDANGRQRQK